MENIKTGDLILESDKSSIAPYIRFITFCEYNHCTVAIRLDTSKLPEMEIVRTGGTLFVLEPRYVGISILDCIKEKQNFDNDIKTLILPLKDKLYTSEFVKHVKNFIVVNCEYLIYENKPVKILNNKNIDKQKYIRRSNDLFYSKLANILCSERIGSLYYRSLNEHINTKAKNYNVLEPATFIKKDHIFNKLFEDPIIIKSVDYSYSYVIIVIVILLILFILYILFY